jgi:hypothetical protein
LKKAGVADYPVSVIFIVPLAVAVAAYGLHRGRQRRIRSAPILTKTDHPTATEQA